MTEEPLSSQGTLFPGALIRTVDEGSVAWQAGIRAGCVVQRACGSIVRDMIDWLWLTSEDEVVLEYRDPAGEVREVLLQREEGQEWGIGFAGAIFDEVRTCRNACTFCFMRQLPPAMRPSLSMRDDDFRLSFLTGTFVTLTNLSDEDVQRIIDQRVSPLRVSLHAVDPGVRTALIGKHGMEGLARLEQLLAAGISFDAQVVLVPGVNDGAHLDETLRWAYDRPGIKTVGIVPLGFTAHQRRFTASFDEPQAALSVLDQIRPFQERALAERREAWVYGADELYRNAYGAEVIEALPDAEFYGDFALYEDGIGILRTAIDEFEVAATASEAEELLRLLKSKALEVRYVCGEAMTPYFGVLLERSVLAGWFTPLVVANRLFGGNVNVTGLLGGEDIASAIAEDLRDGQAGIRKRIYCVPDTVFNADGVTLDDLGIGDIRHLSGGAVYAVPSNPLDYMRHITGIVKEM